MPQTVTGFDSRSDRVRLVVDHVALGQVFVRVLWFSQVSILHTHCFICTLPLPEGQAVEAWESSFGIRRALDREVLVVPFFSCHRSSSASTRYMPRVAHYTKFVAPSCADMQHADFAVLPPSIILPLPIATLCAVVLCRLCSAHVLVGLTISASIPRHGQGFFSFLQTVRTAPGAREGVLSPV